MHIFDNYSHEYKTRRIFELRIKSCYFDTPAIIGVDMPSYEEIDDDQQQWEDDKVWSPLVQIHNPHNQTQHLSSNQLRIQEWMWMWKTQEWAQLQTQEWTWWRTRDVNKPSLNISNMPWNWAGHKLTLMSPLKAPDKTEQGILILLSSMSTCFLVKWI